VLFSVFEHVPLDIKTLSDFSGNERTGMQGVEHAHICCFHRDHQSHAASLSKGQVRMGEAGNRHCAICHVKTCSSSLPFHNSKGQDHQLNHWWFHIMT